MTSEQLRNEYDPDVVTPPGETLQDILEALGMTKAELGLRIGKTPKTIGEIVNNNAAITPDTAVALEKALGAPASFWNNRERRYRQSLASIAEKERLKTELNWLKTMPVRAMVNAGCVKGLKDKTDQVNALLQFFGVSSSNQWRELWLSPQAAFRASRAFASQPEACSAWLRKGELFARELECMPYDSAGFRKALDHIRTLTKETPERFQNETVHLCAQAGVALVFTPPIKGARVYGAARWLTSDKALIQLSLRGKLEDFLWFTFFHEAGHILLHRKRRVFIEMEKDKDVAAPDQAGDAEEVQADQFARDFLIPPRSWRQFTESGQYKNHDSVHAFADKIGISAAIVVGRLQHEGLLPHTHLNPLRRRFDFADAVAPPNGS